MRTIALLYYYRVLHVLKQDNPLSLLSMALLFGAFCWGIIWYAASGLSVEVLYLLMVCIPLPFLYSASSVVALNTREQLFVHSSTMRMLWAGRLLKLRLIALGFTGAGALFFFYSAVAVSFWQIIQQLILYELTLLVWAFLPSISRDTGTNIKSNTRPPGKSRIQGPAVIFLYLLLSALFYLAKNTVPMILLLGAAAVSAILLLVLFLRMPTAVIRLYEQSRQAEIAAQSKGSRRIFGRHVSMKHLNIAGINLAGAAAGVAAVLLIYRYSREVELLPFVALILLNAVWALVVISAAENENYAMPVLAGVRLGHFLVLRVQDYLPAIGLLAVSSAIAGFVWAGWTGITAAVMPVFMTVLSICLYIRYGSLSLPRLVLCAIAYAGLAAIMYYSLLAGITVLICAAFLSRGQSVHYYKERAFDNAEY
ncbi:hypothetical protein [Spirochaeta dissipatitropha]